MALIHLVEPANITSDYIDIVTLTEGVDDDAYVGYTCYITGWGDNNTGQ